MHDLQFTINILVFNMNERNHGKGRFLQCQIAILLCIHMSLVDFLPDRVVWTLSPCFQFPGLFGFLLDFLYFFWIFCISSGFSVFLLDFLYFFWIFCISSGFSVFLLDFLYFFWIF